MESRKRINQNRPPEEDVRIATTSVVNALAHKRFEDALSDAALESMWELIAAVTEGKTPEETQRFVLQFFIDEDPAKLSDPNWVSWVGFPYEIERLEEEWRITPFNPIVMNGTDIVQDGDPGDIPFMVIGWGDINLDRLRFSNSGLWDRPEPDEGRSAS